MDRKDFDNNVDWVVYKVTGRLPTSTNTLLEKHKLPESKRKNVLKFYSNKQNNRYGVLYNNTFLCSCEEDEIEEVQKYFDRTYDGSNLEEIISSLKTKYNLSRRNQTYKDGVLRFSKKDKRLVATINHERKTHTICSCYPFQKEEVTEKFNTLRKTRDLESIKRTMKKQYTIQGKKNRNPRNVDGEITLGKNGTIYKNGKLCKVDPKFYEFVDSFLKN